MRSPRNIVMTLLALVVLSACALWLRECLSVDACLDHGGRWDHDKNQCQMEVRH